MTYSCFEKLQTLPAKIARFELELDTHRVTYIKRLFPVNA
jgi:hypothetical protein